MILSENRFPLFGIMLDAPGGVTLAPQSAAGKNGIAIARACAAMRMRNNPMTQGHRFVGSLGMKTLRGTVPGPLVVEYDLDVQGTIAGDAVVRPECRLHVRGAITGNLTLEPGSSAIIYGTVNGCVRKRGGTLVINHPDPG
jgi:cytoskeletal protein CcmA (bactofilin family)